MAFMAFNFRFSRPSPCLTWGNVWRVRSSANGKAREHSQKEGFGNQTAVTAKGTEQMPGLVENTEESDVIGQMSTMQMEDLVFVLKGSLVDLSVHIQLVQPEYLKIVPGKYDSLSQSWSYM